MHTPRSSSPRYLGTRGLKEGLNTSSLRKMMTAVPWLFTKEGRSRESHVGRCWGASTDRRMGPSGDHAAQIRALPSMRNHPRNAGMGRGCGGRHSSTASPRQPTPTPCQPTAKQAARRQEPQGCKEGRREGGTPPAATACSENQACTRAESKPRARMSSGLRSPPHPSRSGRGAQRQNAAPLTARRGTPGVLGTALFPREAPAAGCHRKRDRNSSK